MLLALLAMSPALADDWVATKLRGKVLELVDNQWQPLSRGDIVSDARSIRTLEGARLELQRDEETISLGPNTQIRVIDARGRRFTTVKQDFGEVAIEAEVEQVEHFAVETPFLAAVVKGTRFVVRSGKSGASVKVLRGRVAVESHADHSSALVTAGQTATVDGDGAMRVNGRRVAPVDADPAAAAPQDPTAPGSPVTPPTGPSSGPGTDDQDDDNDDDNSGHGNSGGDDEDNSGHGSGNSGSGNSGRG
jgi:hypothetical protein